MSEKQSTKADNTEDLPLAAGHSADDRIAAAKAIGTLTSGDKMSANDRRKAHSLLEILSKDSELRVRTALSHVIAEYPFLPQSLAQSLAQDVLEVAGPVLEKSTALSEQFLTELIQSGNASEEAQTKIATRDALPTAVTEALFVSGSSQVAKIVLSNPTAQIDEQGFTTLFAREDLDGQMLTLVAERSDLSEPIVAHCHKIVLADHFDREVGQKIRDQLIQEYRLPPAMAETIVQAALEDALTNASSDTESTRAGFDLLAKRLHQHGDLTPSLLLRMVCDGSLDFAISAFQVLTTKTTSQIEAIFVGAGTTALANLYMESDLDPYFRFALSTAIKRIASEKGKSHKTDPEKPVADIINKIVGFYRGISPSSIDHVIVSLCHESDRWRKDNHDPSSDPVARSNAS